MIYNYLSSVMEIFIFLQKYIYSYYIANYFFKKYIKI